MIMANVTHLDELYAVAKVIDDLLIALHCPPLDREVISATGTDQPIRHILSSQLADWRPARPLGLRKVNVTVEGRRLDLQP
jgi:hypothetical protein